MPQTRFVLRKALALEKKVIVVVNKIDRPAARCALRAHACTAQEAGRLGHGPSLRMLPVSPPCKPRFRPMISRLSDVSLTLLWVQRNTCIDTCIAAFMQRRASLQAGLCDRLHI